MPLSPITPRRISGPHTDVIKCFGGKSAQGQCPWHPFPQYWLSPELQATMDTQEKLDRFRGPQSAPCSAGRILVCASGRQRGMHPVSGSWRLCATVYSHCLPLTHSSFLSTPRHVQFANRNPLFYLKLGVPGCSWLLSTGKETTSLDSSWCQV